MADERNLVDEEDTVKENSAQNRREKKKREKKEKKEKKNAKGNAPEPEEDEDEKGGGRLILVLTTILIIAIWMGIIGILIKTDVGGFGSTVLYPLLKDVPYVNKILPQPEETVEQRASGLFRVLKRKVKAGDTLTVSVFSGVYTSLDDADPVKAAERLSLQAKEKGFAACIRAHRDAWETIWERCEIDTEGDEAAALALHASQYHLNCIAPRHAKNLSIPARGLSGQTYKGAIFWDSEIFFFPMFVYTQPEIAKSLLRYRIETLSGAFPTPEYSFNKQVEIPQLD